MDQSRFKSRYFILSLIAVGLQILSTIVLTFAFMYRELFWLKTPGFIVLGLLTVIASVAGGLSLKRLGYSPWLGAIGLWMSLIPILLFVVLSDKSSSAA